MGVKREILETVKEFKKFWDDYGPFKYALTSNKFPEYILDHEEWLFSDSSEELFKTLLKWKENKMKIIKAPFKEDTYPDNTAPYRINNFPDDLIDYNSRSFNYNGYIAKSIVKKAASEDPKDVEIAFFKDLEETIEDLGYDLLKPISGLPHAHIEEYLKTWLEDENA